MLLAKSTCMVIASEIQEANSESVAIWVRSMGYSGGNSAFLEALLVSIYVSAVREDSMRVSYRCHVQDIKLNSDVITDHQRMCSSALHRQASIRIDR